MIPAPFLFRYSFPVSRLAKMPGRGRVPVELAPSFRLPHPAAMDGQPSFADWRIAWNEKGIGVSVIVERESKSAPKCDVDRLVDSDGVQVWIDTRDTQNIHRASRFCHHFCFLPSGGGRGDEPVARQLAIARSREEQKLAAEEDLAVSSNTVESGWRLDAFLPAKVLAGFDPASHAKLGFYLFVRDQAAGDQFLTVGDEFPFANDPSLWSTLELID